MRSNFFSPACQSCLTMSVDRHIRVYAWPRPELFCVITSRRSLKIKRRYRDFRLSLFDANQPMAEELLKKREIDLAITELEGKPASPIQSCTLLRLPLVLIVPKRSTVRSLKDVFAEGTPPQSVISLPPDEAVTRHFHAGLKKMKLAWTPSIEVSSLELIELYVALGFGIGLSLGAPRRRLRSGLRLLRLPNFSQLTVAALWIGDLSDLSATFLADIKRLAIELK